MKFLKQGGLTSRLDTRGKVRVTHYTEGWFAYEEVSASLSPFLCCTQLVTDTHDSERERHRARVRSEAGRAQSKRSTERATVKRMSTKVDEKKEISTVLSSIPLSSPDYVTSEPNTV